MEYNCEWLKHHINDTDPSTFPCEWAKENWHKTISQITEPFPCDNLREKWEGGGNYRTVLYTDGTFIINEKESDIVNNVALHGDAINVYPALDATYPYEFNDPTERYWDTESSLIKSVEFGSEVKPTKTAWWFVGMGNLTDIDWIGLDTSEVEDMHSMFYNCVTLSNIDLSSFNTSNVKYMSNMFERCSSLDTIDLSSFDTSKVYSMENMFTDCINLINLDLSDFDTSKMINMSYMFKNCSSLENLNLSSFDTSSVEMMSDMFEKCSALTTLDLTSFNTSNVMGMALMFADCSLLKTIYTNGDFDLSNLGEWNNNMFLNCTSLVGGMGTTYDSNNTGAHYARIDNPPTESGYFTAK